MRTRECQLKINTTWREFITGITPQSAFHPPVALRDLAAAESSLAVAFPAELRELLHESDGVEGAHSISLSWPARRIEKDNTPFRQFIEYRALYMPFDHLLFFS